jgi:signal peptidase II
MIRRVEAVQRRWRPTYILFLCSVIVIALDQVTKAIVVSQLREGETVRALGGVLSWTFQRNPGSAFGLFRHFPVVFTILAIAIAVVIVVRAPRVRDMLTGVALGLVLGGAIGNLVDRIARPPGVFRGRVVDFIDLHWWPVFNVADSAVVIGAVLLLIASYRGERRSKEREQAAA